METELKHGEPPSLHQTGDAGDDAGIAGSCELLPGAMVSGSTSKLCLRAAALMSNVLLCVTEFGIWTVSEGTQN